MYPLYNLFNLYGSSIDNQDNLTNTIITNQNITDQNTIKTDQIKTDQIKTDQIKTDQIKTDQIKTDQIKTDQIKTEQNITNTTNIIKTDQIKTEQNTTNIIKTDQNTIKTNQNIIKEIQQSSFREIINKFYNNDKDKIMEFFRTNIINDINIIEEMLKKKFNIFNKFRNITIYILIILIIILIYLTIVNIFKPNIYIKTSNDESKIKFLLFECLLNSLIMSGIVFILFLIRLKDKIGYNILKIVIFVCLPVFLGTFIFNILFEYSGILSNLFKLKINEDEYNKCKIYEDIFSSSFKSLLLLLIGMIIISLFYVSYNIRHNSVYNNIISLLIETLIVGLISMIPMLNIINNRSNINSKSIIIGFLFSFILMILHLNFHLSGLYEFILNYILL